MLWCVQYRNSHRCIIDDEKRAAALWERVKPFVPQYYRGRKVIGLNERLRFLRYDAGEYVCPSHVARFPPLLPLHNLTCVVVWCGAVRRVRRVVRPALRYGLPPPPSAAPPPSLSCYHRRPALAPRAGGRKMLNPNKPAANRLLFGTSRPVRRRRGTAGRLQLQLQLPPARPPARPPPPLHATCSQLSRTDVCVVCVGWQPTDGRYERENGEISQITYQLYLNEGFEGGNTSFLSHESALAEAQMRTSQDPAQVRAPPLPHHWFTSCCVAVLLW